MIKMENLIIIGAANPSVIRLVEDINQAGKRSIKIIGFLDNKFKELGCELYGYRILGGFEEVSKFSRDNVLLINTIAGNVKMRENTTLYFLNEGWNFTNLIHPNTNLGHVMFGTGNIFYENSLIHPFVKIGHHCIFSSNSGVAHNSLIQDFCFIGPASYICGRVSLGRRVYIGAGAKVLPRLIIEDDALIAAGTIVVKNVHKGEKIRGVPGDAY